MNMTRSFFFRALTGTAALLTFAACGGGGGGGGSAPGGGSSTPWTEDYSQHPGITDPGQVDPNADSPLVGITMTIEDATANQTDVLKFVQGGTGTGTRDARGTYPATSYTGNIVSYTYTRNSAKQARLQVQVRWTESGWPEDTTETPETRDYVITFADALNGTIGINGPGSTPVTFAPTSN
ncbi:MAG: hypothetical protein ACI4OZ_01785 [Akkermansia sp.]